MEILRSIVNNLGLDETFFVMFLVFSLTYLFVSQVALKKLTRTLVEREHRTEGRHHDAVVVNRDLDALREKIQTSMQQVRMQASEEFMRIRGNALDEQRRIINGAREVAAAEMKKVRASIQQQFSDEVKKLEADIPKISQSILDKLLQSPVVVTSKATSFASDATGAE